MPQASSQSAPAAPAAPASPAAPARSSSRPSLLTQTTPVQGIPQTRAELDAFIAKRAELASQLEQLTDRRRELSNQRERMSPEAARGHDARIKVIDDRSGRIEQELLQTDDAIAKAVANGVRVGAPLAPRPGDGTILVDAGALRAIRNAASDAVGESVAIATIVLVALTLVWRGFRRLVRRKRPVTAPATVPDHSARLEQLQQSMDVIAIEVERISEAQRYAAKLLNEKAPALAARGDTREKA